MPKRLRKSVFMEFSYVLLQVVVGVRRVTMRRTWRMTMTIMLENNVSSHQANC